MPDKVRVADNVKKEFLTLWAVDAEEAVRHDPGRFSKLPAGTNEKTFFKGPALKLPLRTSAQASTQGQVVERDAQPAPTPEAQEHVPEKDEDEDTAVDETTQDPEREPKKSRRTRRSEPEH